MVILIGIRTKVFLEKEFPQETDPLGGQEGITLAVVQRYVTVFGIPVTGTRKMAKAFSNESGQPIPVLLWTESMKRNADRLMAQTSGAWKRRLPGQIVLWALLFAILFVVYSFINGSKSAKSQDDYRTDPQTGDIVLASESISYNKKDVDHTHSLIVFKIEKITGDSMLIRRSSQKVDAMEQYRIKNKDKLMGLFDLSDNAFLPEAEVYSLSNYREGTERLQRIKLENLTREEQNRQDSIIRYTDIIEPIYIKRP